MAVPYRSSGLHEQGSRFGLQTAEREAGGGRFFIIFLFFYFFTNELMARDVACLVDCLPIMFKLHAGAQASNPSSRETGGMTRIPRSSLTMYSAFEVSLGYKSICFKKKRK